MFAFRIGHNLGAYRKSNITKIQIWYLILQKVSSKGGFNSSRYSK